MSARFWGGPFDGTVIDSAQVNKAAKFVRTHSETGPRTFVLLPPPAEFARMLRGELQGTAGARLLHPYELLRLADGSVEYHYAAGAVGHAIREQYLPLDADQQARKKQYGEYADRFRAQLQNFDVTAKESVILTTVYQDRNGNTLCSVPHTLFSPITLPDGPNVALGRAFAIGMHRDTLLGNIDSLIRNAPTDFVQYPNYESGPLVIQGFELEIVDSNDQRL